MRPMSRIGTITYGHTLAVKWGRVVRNILREKGHIIVDYFNVTFAEVTFSEGTTSS